MPEDAINMVVSTRCRSEVATSLNSAEAEVVRTKRELEHSDLAKKLSEAETRRKRIGRAFELLNEGKISEADVLILASWY
jgi:hypothetical protein